MWFNECADAGTGGGARQTMASAGVRGRQKLLERAEQKQGVKMTKSAVFDLDLIDQGLKNGKTDLKLDGRLMWAHALGR